MRGIHEFFRELFSFPVATPGQEVEGNFHTGTRTVGDKLIRAFLLYPKLNKSLGYYYTFF